MTFKVDSLNPTKFNSLPRRKSAALGEESFQRGTPARRSAGHATSDRCLEYFVPRSLSEFDLSGGGVGLGDLSVLSERAKPDKASARNRDKMVTFEDDCAPIEPIPLQDDVFM